MTPRHNAITAAFAASLGLCAAAFAQSGAGFNTLDTDGSGGLSLSELEAAGANVTAETFAIYDADGSGELSAEEYAAWAGGAR